MLRALKISSELPKAHVLACLHGFGQNPTILEKKLRPWLTIIKKEFPDVIFDFVPAPHALTLDEHKSFGDAKIETGIGINIRLKWWTDTKDTLLTPAEPSVAEEKEIKSSIVYLIERNKVTNHGPYDGFIAYSQGAAMMSLILSQIPFRFGIIISGFPCRFTGTEMTERSIPVSTLHFYGQEDTLVPPNISTHFSERFTQSVLHSHKAGHVIPTDRPSRDILIHFLRELKSTTLK